MSVTVFAFGSTKPVGGGRTRPAARRSLHHVGKVAIPKAVPSRVRPLTREGPRKQERIPL